MYIFVIYWYSVIVCLFAWGFSSHSRIFHSYGDVTITGEGLQILPNARHLWPLSGEGSLACHTYCETGHPFIMVISEVRETFTYCRAFNGAAVTTCFYDLGMLLLWFELPTVRLWGERSNRLRHRRGYSVIITLLWLIKLC